MTDKVHELRGPQLRLLLMRRAREIHQAHRRGIISAAVAAELLSQLKRGRVGEVETKLRDVAAA